MLISNQKPNIYEFSIIEKIYIEILPHQISPYALVYILVALFYQKHWIQTSEYLLIFFEAPCTLNENKSLIAHIRMISLSFWWYAMHKLLVLISMIIQLCIWNNWYEKVSTANPSWYISCQNISLWGLILNEEDHLFEVYY